ncbi:Gfo/Idh/MocA family protein [Hoeflea sp.]|uniref:Gfo/Idh/MocA family protein n=1 Tax=Hoeflea sp. TaxID=1940281 RepID=UPI003A8FB42E
MLQKSNSQGTVGVAIIGAGERGVYFIGSRMAELSAETGFRIVGVHDLISDRAKLAADHLNGIYAAGGISHAVAPCEDLGKLLDDPRVDLVLVTTHTDAHRVPLEMAIKAGKRVYLDKPISVTLDDASAILAAEKAGGLPVMMGFTRRYEKPWIEAVSMAHRGRIGDPQMILLRSVIPYTRYLQLWHRTQAKSGGAINDKCSHHFDVLRWVAGSEPETITAIGGRSGIFRPDPDAPARCSECTRDCPYRRHETLVDRHEGVGQVPNRSWTDAARIEDRNDNCVFLPGSDIDDHAVISVKFENGISACIFFSIFGPWATDQETLEIVGSSGRLRMERHTGGIDLISEYGHRHERIDFNQAERSSSHFGADLELVRTMARFVAGETPPVGPSDGLASLRMVVAAQQSLENGGAPVDPRALEIK